MYWLSWFGLILVIYVITASSQTVPNLQPNLDIDGSNENCTCVPYYLCRNGTINTDGEGIIDIRKEDGPCKNYILSCCKREDQLLVPLNAPSSLPFQVGCGYRRPNGVGFKITGDKENESQYGEFPWMVAVLGNNIYQCGGSLIHPSVVMTAAHCVVNREKTFTIRAGEWDTQHTVEPFPHQNRDVETIVIHPEYYSGALYNDVALLILTEPVKLTAAVDVICLPPLDATIKPDICYANGWGRESFEKEGKSQSILKKIDLRPVQRDACQEKLRATRLGEYFILHRSFMCAGGESGKDTCMGDGGGPLVCPFEDEPDKYFQVGIVSWGIGCGNEDVPGVYANVISLSDWIFEQLDNYGFETSVIQDKM